MYSVTGKESLKVSSIHHQAVKKLACGFKASAFADDGVIESIESDSEHIWGVQFHPEFKSRPNRAHPLFRDFIRASIEYSEFGEKI